MFKYKKVSCHNGTLNPRRLSPQQSIFYQTHSASDPASFGTGPVLIKCIDHFFLMHYAVQLFWRYYLIIIMDQVQIVIRFFYEMDPERAIGPLTKS